MIKLYKIIGQFRLYAILALAACAPAFGKDPLAGFSVGFPADDPSCRWISGNKKTAEPLQAPELAVRPKLRLPPFETRLSEKDEAKKGILFQWEPLNGANYYRLQIYQPNKPVLERTLKTTRFLSRPLDPGNYRWRVSALYPMKNAGPEAARWICTGTASDWWDLSLLTESDVQRELIENSSTGNTFLSFSSRLVAYLYRSSSSLSPGGSASPAMAAAATLEGEYRLSPLFSVGGSFENTFYRIEGRGVNGTALELGARAKLPIKQKPGWMQYPRLGLRFQRYFVFTRPCSGCPPPYTEAIAMAVAISNELSRQINPQSRLALSLELNYPIALASAPDASSLAGFNLNVAVSLYSTLELSHRWELRYGGRYEHRGLQFESGGSEYSTQLDSVSAFLSGVFRFPP